MNSPKKATLGWAIFGSMGSDFLFALISGVITIIALEIAGYDIGAHGLRWWFFVIALIIFFVPRVAWSRRKGSQ